MLEIVERDMDLKQDPYVKGLLQREDEHSQTRLEKFWTKPKTFCSEQVAAFYQSSNSIFEELGGWATDWYIWQCLRNFNDMVDQHEELLSEWTTAEKIYLLDLLRDVQACTMNPCEAATVEMSPKAQHLVNLLARESSPDFTGLVFVKQRATVAALAELLAVHPDVRDLYKLGTFVGTSTNGKRKFKFADKVDLREQQQSLEDFRIGKKNLILGTSVLEEGIDVTACNSVTCFEAPENLKSYIQRRGRARMQGSKYAIFLEEPEATDGLEKWRALEEDMRKAYMDELREVQVLSDLENSEKSDGRTFRVEDTGALLTIENALPHLHHFCATLAADVYVDSRPQFTKIHEAPDAGTFRMEVILPSTLDPLLRRTASLKTWKTEKVAKKDAAFEAYMKLYRAGLVNKNLLPYEVDPDVSVMDSTSAPSIVFASGLLNPWKLAVSHQEKAELWYTYLVTVFILEQEPVKMMMLLPADVGEPADLGLYWNETTQYNAHFEMLGTSTTSPTDLYTLRQLTKLLLTSVFGSRMKDSKSDFVALFAPLDSRPLQNLLQDFEGQKSASEMQSIDAMEAGLVRQIGAEGRPLLLHAFETDKQPLSEDSDVVQGGPELMVRITKFPKRRDFLHPLPKLNALSESYTTVDMLPARDCVIDNLPSRYSLFALFVPSILHRCGLNLIARDLCANLLRPVGFNDLDLVRAAITASSTNDPLDYQRLEFLGDGILKYYTAVRVFDERPNFPEKYLSIEKGRLVSNATLAKVALENGVDKYIIRTPFTGQKWRPLYATEALEHKDDLVQISRKVLADVVEALIGASYVDGGWTKAQQCVEVFFPPDSTIPHPPSASSTLPASSTLLSLQKLEELIGYTFSDKNLLLEAMTHASFTSNLSARSYDRLEFLGDAILDAIITPHLYHHRRRHNDDDDGQTYTPLPHAQMHLIHTAVVNADFLAFCCLSFSIPEACAAVVRDAQAPSRFGTRRGVVDRYLWQYMRKGCPDLAAAQEATVKRYGRYQQEVKAEFETGQGYPWMQLMRIQADKFFSDLVESVLGAIFLDSGRDLRACEGFVERLGILRVLDRMARDGVDVMHPKERLGVLAGSEGVDYQVVVAKGMHYCFVHVGNREVASGEGCVAEIARTDAAANAVRILRKG